MRPISYLHEKETIIPAPRLDSTRPVPRWRRRRPEGRYGRVGRKTGSTLASSRYPPIPIYPRAPCRSPPPCPAPGWLFGCPWGRRPPIPPRTIRWEAGCPLPPIDSTNRRNRPCRGSLRYSIGIAKRIFWFGRRPILPRRIARLRHSGCRTPRGEEQTEGPPIST